MLRPHPPHVAASLLRESGPISYEARPSACFQPVPSACVNISPTVECTIIISLAHVRILDPQPPLMRARFARPQAFAPPPGARAFLHRPSLRSAATARAPPSPGVSGIRAQILVFPMPATHVITSGALLMNSSWRQAVPRFRRFERKGCSELVFIGRAVWSQRTSVAPPKMICLPKTCLSIFMGMGGQKKTIL